MAHRFLGWSVATMFWCQFLLLTNDHKEDKALGKVLIHDPYFWLLFILSCEHILIALSF